MNIIIRSMATAAVLAVLSLPVFAQQGLQRAPAGGQPSDEQREEVRRKMEVIKMSRLTEELKLDETTAARFIPVITALNQKRRSLMNENRHAMQELRTELNAPQPDEGRMRTAISRIEKNQREIASLREKELKAVRENLSVAQQARYVLFNQEFVREMRGMMEGARGSGPGKGGMGPGQGRGPGMGGGPKPVTP
jgi:Spy/CpxP family protein refolding chaperone